jgi:hypothetical protein
MPSGRLSGTRSSRSFDWKPCEGCLSLQGFESPAELRSPIEKRRQEYAEMQLHSGLGVGRQPNALQSCQPQEGAVSLAIWR